MKIELRLARLTDRVIFVRLKLSLLIFDFIQNLQFIRFSKFFTQKRFDMDYGVVGTFRVLPCIRVVWFDVYYLRLFCIKKARTQFFLPSCRCDNQLRATTEKRNTYTFAVVLESRKQIYVDKSKGSNKRSVPLWYLLENPTL